MSRSVALDARTPAAVLLSLLLVLSALIVSAPAVAADSSHTEPVRFATFNASLNRNFEGQALADLSAPFDPAEADTALRTRRAQAATVAEIIQRVRPEILLINEFDYVDGPLDGNALTDRVPGQLPGRRPGRRAGADRLRRTSSSPRRTRAFHPAST